MSSTISTRTVATFEVAPIAGLFWRAVEAQHRIATTALVDSLDEQRQLEDLLEDSKPDLPDALSDLHWLLFTPFRYPPLPYGSRFRGPYDPGVFYAAFEARTACAELGFWRWRFLQDAEALSRLEQRPHTVFSTRVGTGSVDLRDPPYAADRGRWTHPSDYAPCQQLARDVREAGVGAIAYESVRDPEHGGCLALLDARAFVDRLPASARTWHLWVNHDRVTWRLDTPFEEDTFQFDTAPWAAQMSAAPTSSEPKATP